MSPLSINQISLLQRSWRRFADSKRVVAKDARVLAETIGTKILSPDFFYQHAMSGHRTIIIINGNSNDPTIGHSSFIVKKMFYELTCYRVDEIEQNKHKTFYTSMYSFPQKNKDGVTEVLKSVIANREKVIFDTVFRAKHTHLVRKGVVFLLNKDCEKHFIIAFEKIRTRFTQLPYTYGLGFNCNTFVFEVLKEIFNLRIKHGANQDYKVTHKSGCAIL